MSQICVRICVYNVQPKYLSRKKLISKCGYIHSIEYHTENYFQVNISTKLTINIMLNKSNKTITKEHVPFIESIFCFCLLLIKRFPNTEQKKT